MRRTECAHAVRYAVFVQEAKICGAHALVSGKGAGKVRIIEKAAFQRNICHGHLRITEQAPRIGNAAQLDESIWRAAAYAAKMAQIGRAGPVRYLGQIVYRQLFAEM